MQILPGQAPIKVNLNIFIVAHVIYHKDWYTHASFLVNDMKALNVFKLNFSNVLRFIYKRKQNLNLHVFHNIFTHRTKTK